MPKKEALGNFADAKNLKSETIRNSFWNIVSRIIGRGGGFIFGVIIARLLLPEKFGLYSIGLAVASIFLVFVELGFNTLNVKYVSEELGKKKPGKASAGFKYLLKNKFALGIIASIVFMLLAKPLSVYVFKKDLTTIFLFFSLYVLIFSLETFFESSFYAVKKIKTIGKKEFLFQLIKIFLVLAFFWILPEEYYIIGVITSITFALFIAIIFMVFKIKKDSPYLLGESSSLKQDEKRKLIKNLIQLGSIGLTAAVFSYMDSIMIGLLVPSGEFVGYYRAAFNLVFALATIFLMGNIFTPIFTQVNKKNLQKLFREFFRYSVLISVPLISGIILFNRYIIKTIYGAEYLPASLPLIVLSFLIFEVIISKLFSSVLIAKDNLKFLTIFTIVIAALNIVLNYALINYFLNFSQILGMLGAAIATVISRYCFMIGVFIFLKSRFKLSPDLKIISKAVTASLIMVFILYAINFKFVHNMNLIIGLSEVVLGVIIYTGTMFLLKGIRRDDFTNLKLLFK